VEHWNGIVWTAFPSQTPPHGGTLSGVSCPTTTTCYAIGGYATGPFYAATFSERLTPANPGSFVLVNSATPGFGADLFGLSCATTTTCYAVGRDFPMTNGPPFIPLVEELTFPSGVPTFVAVSSQSPGGTYTGQLRGVSCPTTTTCYAVGDFSNAFGTLVRTLAERLTLPSYLHLK
jgi:hypothetical protein